MWLESKVRFDMLFFCCCLDWRKSILLESDLLKHVRGLWCSSNQACEVFYPCPRSWQDVNCLPVSCTTPAWEHQHLLFFTHLFRFFICLNAAGLQNQVLNPACFFFVFTGQYYTQGYIISDYKTRARKLESRPLKQSNAVYGKTKAFP